MTATFNLKLKAFPGIFQNIRWNLSEHSPESSWTFPGIFFDTISQNLFEHSRNLLGHSSEFSWAFLGIILNIPWNLLEHSLGSSRTFSRIFNKVPRNLMEHTTESSRAFPGILKWEHSPESSWTFPAFPAFFAFRSSFLYSWFYK